MNKKGSKSPGGPKGFAAMTPAGRRVCGSLGGKLAHLGGKAHEYTTDEARREGTRGGKQTAARNDMSAIGKLGGRPRKEVVVPAEPAPVAPKPVAPPAQPTGPDPWAFLKDSK